MGRLCDKAKKLSQGAQLWSRACDVRHVLCVPVPAHGHRLSRHALHARTHTSTGGVCGARCRRTPASTYTRPLPPHTTTPPTNTSTHSRTLPLPPQTHTHTHTQTQRIHRGGLLPSPPPPPPRRPRCCRCCRCACMQAVVARPRKAAHQCTSAQCCTEVCCVGCHPTTGVGDMGGKRARKRLAHPYSACVRGTPHHCPAHNTQHCGTQPSSSTVSRHHHKQHTNCDREGFSYFQQAPHHSTAAAQQQLSSAHASTATQRPTVGALLLSNQGAGWHSTGGGGGGEGTTTRHGPQHSAGAGAPPPHAPTPPTRHHTTTQPATPHLTGGQMQPRVACVAGPRGAGGGGVCHCCCRGWQQPGQRGRRPSPPPSHPHASWAASQPPARNTHAPLRWHPHRHHSHVPSCSKT
jgi:hypothetical protein